MQIKSAVKIGRTFLSLADFKSCTSPNGQLPSCRFKKRIKNQPHFKTRFPS
ncbi:hypothetical protein HMPREF9996_00033 [Aggregatibacter actinomycetemcomitans Y4]|nr:hypothetical protein HMPREF9996_00033 [Aggregatibacter actinomycetemcomitans Y4]